MHDKHYIPDVFEMYEDIGILRIICDGKRELCPPCFG